MTSRSLEILRDFCLTPAPSGFEKELAIKLADYMKPLCDSVERDYTGNVIGKIAGRDSSLKPIIVNAHMDRVGFIVSFISDEGFIKLQKIGTPNDKVLPGLVLLIRVKDRSRWIPAVVGTKCAHLLSPEEQIRAETIDKLMVDVGVDSAEEVRALGIEIGCPAVYNPSFIQLPGTRVCGTAMDNCGCLTALVAVAERLSTERPERDTYLVGNVWEEHNQRAATFPVRALNPIVDISMDMLLAGDTPDVRGYVNGSMGKGPMASCFNFCSGPFNGTIAHDGLYDLAEQVAAELGTGIQRYVCINSLGDNAYSQLEGDGPAVIEIGSAVRYAHSSCEVADLTDIDNLALLVAGMVKGIGHGFLQTRY